MSKYHHLFEVYLSEHEGRYTSQKRMIAEEIFKSEHHFEVENFIDDFRSKVKKLSRATVYRTIKQLLEAGLLQKVMTRDGKVFYERSIPDQQHDHLICNGCGKILEIKDTHIQTYLDAICEKMNFRPGYRSLHIYGVCGACNKDSH